MRRISDKCCFNQLVNNLMHRHYASRRAPTSATHWLNTPRMTRRTTWYPLGTCYTMMRKLEVWICTLSSARWPHIPKDSISGSDDHLRIPTWPAWASRQGQDQVDPGERQLGGQNQRHHKWLLRELPQLEVDHAGQASRGGKVFGSLPSQDMVPQVPELPEDCDWEPEPPRRGLDDLGARNVGPRFSPHDGEAAARGQGLGVSLHIDWFHDQNPPKIHRLLEGVGPQTRDVRNEGHKYSPDPVRARHLQGQSILPIWISEGAERGEWGVDVQSDAALQESRHYVPIYQRGRSQSNLHKSITVSLHG